MERALQKLGLLLALVAVGSVVGCGSGDSSSEIQPLTHKEFAHRAQAYCHHGYEAQADAMKAYAVKHGLNWREPSAAEREKVNTAVVLGFVERKIAFWRSMPPPPGEEAQVRRIIASMERGLADSQAHPEWLAAPTQAHPDPFTETRELTGKYGPWLCGQA